MLDGLLLNPSGTETTNQTRAGIPMYRGGAFGFEEWKFKILGRVQALKNQIHDHDENSKKEMEDCNWPFF